MRKVIFFWKGGSFSGKEEGGVYLFTPYGG